MEQVSSYDLMDLCKKSKNVNYTNSMLILQIRVPLAMVQTP